MLPWTDNSTQTKVVKALPVICAAICVVAAVVLFFYW